MYLACSSYITTISDNPKRCYTITNIHSGYDEFSYALWLAMIEGITKHQLSTHDIWMLTQNSSSKHYVTEELLQKSYCTSWFAPNEWHDFAYRQKTSFKYFLTLYNWKHSKPLPIKPTYDNDNEKLFMIISDESGCCFFFEGLEVCLFTTECCWWHRRSFNTAEQEIATKVGRIELHQVI